MPRTIEKTIYKFDELSDEAKERAREWWHEASSGDEIHEFIYDDAVACGAILGIEFSQKPIRLMNGNTRYDPTIYYTGFSSQGDGACFEGTYSYAKACAKKIRQHAPNDRELHRIADALQELQSHCGYRLDASMSHRGHYHNSGCMDVDVGHPRDALCNGVYADQLTQLMRDFADWIYAALQAEYEYRNSNEQVDESIRINEYEFDEDGRIVS